MLHRRLTDWEKVAYSVSAIVLMMVGSYNLALFLLRSVS